MRERLCFWAVRGAEPLWRVGGCSAPRGAGSAPSLSGRLGFLFLCVSGTGKLELQRYQ